MTKAKWTITVLQPAPSMMDDKFNFDGTYQEAVDETHRLFTANRRTARLWSRGDTTGYWWHGVNGRGEATDRNTNSGVVFTAQY